MVSCDSFTGQSRRHYGLDIVQGCARIIEIILHTYLANHIIILNI